MSFSLPDRPGIGQRVGAWLSAWQYVLWLLALLVLSVGLNVWQWKRAIRAADRIELAAKSQALEDAEAVNAEMRRLAWDLIKAGDLNVGMFNQASKNYQAAVAKAPLTNLNCAPGTGRMEATNRALGAPVK